MKKHLFLMMLLTNIWIATFAQQTTMTVDCQTPGWLSSKINYGDQKTVENLTITGYLNSTDIEFLRELNLEHNLHGVLDLSEVRIVPSQGKYATEENKLQRQMFNRLNTFKKVVLPIHVTESNLYSQSESYAIRIDTIVVKANVKKINIGSFTHCKALYLPEGVETVYLGSYFLAEYDVTLVFPNSLQRIFTECGPIAKTTIYSYIMDPQQFTAYYKGEVFNFNAGKLYVPKGTKELYNRRPFPFSNYYKIGAIVEMTVPGVIVLNKENYSMYVGDTYKMTAKVLQNDDLDKYVKWKSLNENIATVDQEGKIIAKAFGKTQIIAETSNGLQAVCELNVYDHAQEIKMPKQMQLNVGQSRHLQYEMLPTETTDGKVTWKSDKENVATIDDEGNVKAIGRGTCTITATAADGACSAICEVTVTQPITKISLSEKEVTLFVGKSLQLTAERLPSDADNKTLLWYSSNEDVATVKDGIVLAKTVGIAFITVSSSEDKTINAECKVMVIPTVTGVIIDKTNVELEVGKTLTLAAKVLPENASNKNVKWWSSKPEVCQVTDKGMLVALTEGTSNIVATTEEGGFIATCVVTVKLPTGIDGVYDNQAKSCKYYTPNGERVTTPQIGELYIVKYNDGTVKKVVFGK